MAGILRFPFFSLLSHMDANCMFNEVCLPTGLGQQGKVVPENTASAVGLPGCDSWSFDLGQIPDL